MTIDERIEFLLKAQESREVNPSRLFELQAQTGQALERFISRTDVTLNTMARILERNEHRLTDLEGGAQ
jgi:hypothetical protein